MNNCQSLPGFIATLTILCILISGVSLYILSQPILSLAQESEAIYPELIINLTALMGFSGLGLLLFGYLQKWNRNGAQLPLESEPEFQKLYQAFLREVEERHRIQQELSQTQEQLTDLQMQFQNLQKTEAQFRLVADSTYDWEYWLSSQGNFIYVSPSCERITGYSATEFLENPQLLSQIIHPQDREKFVNSFVYKADADQVQASDFRLIHHQGDIRWISHWCQSIYSPDGVWLGQRASNRDITIRKQVEAALQDSEERYRRLIETSLEGFWIIDAENKTTFVNTQMATMLGYSIEEMMGRSLFEFMDDEEYEIALNYVERRHQGISEQHDFKFCRQTGEPLWTMLSTSPIYDQAGNYTGAFALVTDITARKQMENALRESEARFRWMADTSPVLMWISGTDGLCYFFNQTWLNFTGKTLEEEFGNGWAKGVHADDLEPCLDTYLSAFQRRINFSMEYRLQRADSEYRWLLDMGVPRFTPDGDFLGYIGSCIDITERKDAEEAIKTQQGFIQKIADSTPCILYIYDLTEKRLSYSNYELTEILGYTEEDIKNFTWKTIKKNIYPEDLKKILECFKQLKSGEEDKTFQFECRFKHKQGGWYWLSHRTMVFSRTSTGKPKQLLGTASDITERKQTQETLKKMNEKLLSWVKELECRNQEMVLLKEMNEFLQVCMSLEEAYAMVGDLIKPLFPQCSGAVFVITASKNMVDAVTRWGHSMPCEHTFSSIQCWALRRGQIHWVDQNHTGLLCQHIHPENIPTESLCLPMMAQGEALGLLHIRSETAGIMTDSKRQLAQMVSENLGLALANLELREKLRHQSIRDPLTGLYNRRYMEESLEREITRANRGKYSVGIVMLDVDHFKKFNDTYGHEMGDQVLIEISNFLQQNIRNSDIACRYGGEELTLIFPETSLEDCQQRAEQIRQRIKELKIYNRNQFLSPVTISLGIAIFPQQGITAKLVIQEADKALYQAKVQGRDRVVVAN